MSTSYNGWIASPYLRTRPLVVAGESFIPGVLDNDAVYKVLRYIAEQMNARVEPIVRSDWHGADDWGYNYRATTGNSSSLSCHASGTAIDYNATRHPYGVSAYANFSSTQIATIHHIINVELDGVVKWGGDYNGSPDAMHFEIYGTAAKVAAVAARLPATGPIQKEDDMTPAQEKKLDRLAADVDTLLKRTGKDADIRTKLERAIAKLDRLLEKHSRGG